MMIKKTLMLLILMTTLSSQCTDNCLRCVENVCYYCDLSQGYRLIEGQCKLWKEENCYLFDDLGTCLICDKGYHLEGATQRCIKIMLEDMIENCNVYDSLTTCIFCQAGFFLNNGKCEKITNPIANCEVENSQQICLNCQNGFIISIDQKTCLPDPNISNCQSYQLIKCNSCSDGFLQVPNFNLSQIFSLVTNAQKANFVKMKYQDGIGNINQPGYNNCLQTNIPFCESYYRFDFCGKCQTGYLRDEEGKCKPQPLDRIPNCAKYKAVDSCIECQPFFWLKDQSNCLPISPIDHCKVYSNQLGKKNCVECEETHFLIGYNNCEERTQKVENCNRMHPLQENCESCNNTFILTDDKLKCLPLVSNCNKYAVSSYLSENLNCLRCNQGFYLNKEQNLCNQGDIQYCLIYETQANVCQTCQNKYYLSDGFCEPHDIIPSCQVYHQRLKNVCSDCNYESFNFEKRTDCIKTTTIENCAIFEDQNTCAQCMDKYYLTTDGLCELIPPSENCVQRIGNQCHVCYGDFILEKGKCLDPLDYIQNECASHNVDGKTDYERQKCFYCDVNRIPINYKDNHICVELDYMMYRQDTTTLDSNCLIYDQDHNDKFTCIRCQFPKVLNEGNCVDECPNNKTLYKQLLKPFNRDANRVNESYSVDNVNVCWDLIPNCKVASPDIYQPHQSKVQYQCVTCMSGSVPIVDFVNSNVLIQDPFNEEIQYGNSPVSFRPAKVCVTVSDQTILGEINVQSNQIENCDLYTNLGLTIGCTKCIHGFSGVVLDVVNQCEIYINNKYTCSKCKHGYYKSSIYECRPVQTVDQCLYYSQTSNTTKCIECNTGYYVQSDTRCSQRTQSIAINCLPEKLSDTCKCISTHFNISITGGYQCEAKPLNCITPINQQSCQTCDQTNSFKKTQNQGGTINYVCQAGGITDCVKYKVDEQVCLKCNEGAYLKDGYCVKHVSLEKCEQRAGSKKNTCETCNKGSIIFDYTTKCLEINKIEHCLEYDSIQTCLKCKDNFRLDNLRARCIGIPANENCITQVPFNIYDSSDQTTGFIDIYDAKNLTDFVYTCQKCKDGYFLVDKTVTFDTTKQITLNNATQNHPKVNTTITVKVCKNYNNPLIDSGYCLEHNVDGTTEFSKKAYCTTCKSGYFPEILNNDRYICMDQSYLESKSDNRSFANCSRVSEFTAGKYTCDLCNYDYYYDSITNTCVQDCGAKQKFIQILNLVNTDYLGYHAQNRTCQTDTSVTNCDIYATSINTTTLKCVKCKSGFAPAYIAAAQAETLFTTYNPMNSTLELENPLGLYRAIDECYNPSGDAIIGNKGPDKLIANCAKYIKHVATTNGNFYSCMQCNIGFSGKIEAETATGDTLSVMTSCSAITDCDLNATLNDNTFKGGRWVNDQTAFSGIASGFWIQELYSCFACTGNKTPVLFGKFDYAGPGNLFEAYGFPSDTTTLLNAHTTKDGTGIQCLQLYNADGTVPTTAGTAGYLQDINGTTQVLFGNAKGCALAWGNTNLDLKVNTLNCTACKPGYKPFYTAAPANTAIISITKCVEIEFCTDDETTGKWLNGCYNCVHYYDYWNVDETTNKTGHLIDFKRCVQTRENISTTNCYAAYHSGPCQICQKGYIKNADDVCVQQTISQCNNYNIFNNASYNSNGIQLYPNPGALVNVNARILQHFLYYREFHRGCTECNSGYISMKVSSAAANVDSNYLPHFCTQNPKNPIKPTTAQETKNCINYGLKDPLLSTGTPTTNQQLPSLLVCKKCSAQYVLTSDNQCTPRCPLDYWNSTTNVCQSGITSNLLNCQEANEMNGTTCVRCNSDKLNVAGVCVDFNTTTPIKNCSEYNKNDSYILPYALCIKCLDGFYLSDDKKLCIEIPLDNCATWGLDGQRNKTWCLTCKSNFLLIEKKNLVQYCYPLSLDESLPDNQGQCEQWDRDLFITRKLECKKCKLGTTKHYFKIKDSNEIEKKTQCLSFPDDAKCKSYDVKPNPSAVHPEKATFPTAPFGTFFHNTFNCLSCQEDSGTDKYKTYWYDQAYALCRVRSQVTNCKVHSQFKDECNQCEDNYLLENNSCIRLKVDDNVEPINKGYIQKCQKFDECDGKVQYQGLHHHLQSIVSCHQCNDQTQIPFVGVKVKDNKLVSLQEYGFPAPTSKFFHEQNKNKSVECLKPEFGTFGVLPTDWTFPANCGLGIINSNEIAKTSLTQQGVFCGACKPGYKATYATNNKYYITACTAIDKCESSSWFNNCSQCLPEHTYQYVVNQGVQYDVCLNFQKNPNCFAAEQMTVGATTVLRCQFCKNGYIMNPDGYCENLLAPRCAQFKFNFRTNYEIHDLNTGLVINQGAFGCQKCDEGFVAIYEKKDNVACTASPYHTDQQLTENSNYIYQCKNYNVTPLGELICRECNVDFVLTIRGKCLPIENLKNCKIALDSSKCRECMTGFVEIDRVCEQGSIQNCQVYANNDQSYYQICEKCENGFYLQDNQCLEGHVDNCEEYISDKKCQKCKNKFALVYTTELNNYCYPISESMNCADVDQEAFREGDFVCKQCSSNEYFLNWEREKFELKNTCQKFLGKDNCIKYDSERFFYDSTFVCTKCDHLFYLDQNNNCTNRTVLLEKCTVYSTNSDKCEQCEKGFFISTDGLKCVPYPDGIPNCQRYLSDDLCILCNTGFFLKKNECLKIKETQMVENCLVHSDNGECQQCVGGYLWVYNQCVQVQALNCASFENIHTCSTCMPGFGFQYSEDNKFLNCVDKKKQNCLLSEDWVPFKCLKCEAHFYIDSSPEANCVAVPVQIEHCVDYETDKLCRQCAKGTALTSDQTACLLNVQITTLLDPNCQDNKITPQPTCQTCKWGHVFTYGLCMPCKLNTLEDGCMNCDPQDQTKCLLCISGYYMNEFGNCVKNGTVQTNPTDGNGNGSGSGSGDGNGDGSGDGDGTPKSQMIMSVMKMMILIFLTF